MALKRQQPILLVLLVSATWLTTNFAFAKRLGHKLIDAHDLQSTRRNDFYRRQLSSKSASKSGKSGDSYSSKSSKSSDGKSAKSSSGKSSKASYYDGHSSDADIVSIGKSSKASESLNDPLPFHTDSNDVGTPSFSNNGNSNDIALQFEASSELTGNSEFFPIIFESPDPEVMMASTDEPTKVPTDSPTVKPSLKPTADPTFKPTADPTLLPTPVPTLPCGLSSDERSQNIINILGAESADPNSPQGLALDWITNKDGLYLCPDNEEALIQRYVAAVFYFSTGGGSWNQCNAPDDLDDPAEVGRANDECSVLTSTFPDLTSGSNAWLTATSECEWGGLACLPDGSVAELSFENNGFVGTLPTELKEWSELRRLALQQGGLYGTIPVELSSLSNLLVLDLDYNKLTGVLPGEIFGNWKVLKELDLNNNLLGGTISTRIGELVDLRFLQLDSNSFTGTIPTQLGQLDMLIFLSAADLALNGMMPSQVCENRGEPTNPANGNLAVLIADCDPADQRVFCECCSDCGVQEQSAIVAQLAPFWIAQRDQSGML